MLLLAVIVVVVCGCPFLELGGDVCQVLIRNMDTTAQEQADHLKQLVASRYLALLSLFRSKCSALTEGAALLMRLIVLEADVGTARAMQEVWTPLLCCACACAVLVLCCV